MHIYFWAAAKKIDYNTQVFLYHHFNSKHFGQLTVINKIKPMNMTKSWVYNKKRAPHPQSKRNLRDEGALFGFYDNKSLISPKPIHPIHQSNDLVW